MIFVAVLATGAALVFQLRGLLLLVFGGILLAVALDGDGRWPSWWCRCSR
ncbi:MAG: hypothetical protein HQL41_04780 [Alphaproteobacteria bacterium]|nr:hypothetical protein [Alphaproteobacteria bacterium]